MSRRKQPRARQRKSARRPPSRRRSIWAKALGAGIIILLLAVGGILGWSFRRPATSEADEVVHFRVDISDRARVVLALEALGLVENSTLMGLYVGYLAPGAHFAQRDHLLRTGLSPREIVQRLAEVGDREAVSVGLPEGWNHQQMAERLEQMEVCSSLGFQEAVEERPLLDELGIEAPTAEGWLFPATYTFRVDTDPRDVVRRLVKESHRRLEKLRAGHPLAPELRTLGFEEQQVVNLASIVEKETASQSERGRVARVFLNRLLAPEGGTKGRLQSDPTAAYGCLRLGTRLASCNGYSGRVRAAMLTDAANPYNTYRHSGLPPTPIANPGELALSAVLHAPAGRELYFVADGQGGHRFSVSYSEHKKAVAQLRARRGRTESPD